MFYIASLIFFIFGISIINDPTPSMGIFGYPNYGDITQIKWELGITFMFIGIVLAYFEYKKKKVIEYSICPECKKNYFCKDIKEDMCPKCNVKTIEIDEYYNK